MGAKVNSNTHSVGVSTRQVTISSITPDGSTAVCIDKTGVEVRVPMYWQPGKGQPPAVGENWILTQDLGQHFFPAELVSAGGILLVSSHARAPFQQCPDRVADAVACGKQRRVQRGGLARGQHVGLR